LVRKPKSKKYDQNLTRFLQPKESLLGVLDSLSPTTAVTQPAWRPELNSTRAQTRTPSLEAKLGRLLPQINFLIENNNGDF
jgi:hypothetical protein